MQDSEGNPIIRLTRQYVNWNYVGLVAGVLTVMVTIYNINNYYENIKKGV